MARKKVVVFLMALVLMALLLPMMSPMTVSAHQTVTVDVPQPAAYPSSPGELGQPAYGGIMWGQLHGCRTGWGGTNEASGVRAAFQGNANTFFDPAGETQDCFVGMIMPEPYFLTEVRILRRAGRNDRFDGMMLQGSNDGAAWTTLHHVQLIPGDPGVGAPIGNTGRRYLLSSEGWRVIPAYEIEHNTGWTHFRWVTQGPGLHGDVAEVEFWGTSNPSEVPLYSPHILRNAEIIDYSSATAANPATNVNNMSRRTRWQVEDGDNNHFITFDLGEVREFQRLSVLEWRNNIQGWAFLGSNDNVTWDEIVSADTGFLDGADLSPFFHVNFDPVNYRYVRFEFTGQSASFWEIGLFNSRIWIPTVYVPPDVFDTRTLTLYTFCVSERHYMDLYDLRRSNFADIQPLDFILPVGISFRVRQTNPNFQGNHMWDVQGARNDTRTFTGNITMQLHNRYSGRQQITIPPTGEWVTVQSGNNMPVIPVIRTPYTPVGYTGGPPVLEFEVLCEDYLLDFFQTLADNPPPYVPTPPFNPASLTTIPAGSRAAGQPELPAMSAPATGEIMRGEPIGMGAGWGSNIRGPFNGNVNPASSNIFDPAARATRTHPDGWVGMRMPERYVLSEIRMIMRPGRHGRLQGGMIFGWNGGGRFDPDTATLIWQHESTVGGQNLDPPNTPAPWFVITSDMFEPGANTGFTSFAYVNFYNHGEVNELELWGTGTGVTDGGGGNGTVTLPHRIHLPVYTYTNSRTWIPGVNDDFTDISAWDAWITPEATAAHAQFISEWTDQPYAIIRGNSATIVVAEADFFRVRDLVHFVNLDQLLGYYDHMYAVYDWLSGLDPAHHQNGHFVYWQDTDWGNVDPRHSAPATTVLATPSHPGAGMGYWASTHMGQAGYSVFAYLYRSWLTLHEVGHGYHGTHFGHQGNIPMGETWNDVFSFFYQSMYIMPVQPIFEGGSVIVNSWAYYQDRPFHERRVRDLRLSGRSFANNTEDRFRLWFFIPMFEYLGPEGLRDFNRMYREMFATNQDGIRNWTQQDVFLTLLYRTSGYNFLPYFQEWHKNAANATTRAEIENGVILRILYDEVPYPSIRRALIEAHGLVSDFSLIPETLLTEEAIREVLDAAFADDANKEYEEVVRLIEDIDFILHIGDLEALETVSLTVYDTENPIVIVFDIVPQNGIKLLYFDDYCDTTPAGEARTIDGNLTIILHDEFIAWLHEKHGDSKYTLALDFMYEALGTDGIDASLSIDFEFILTGFGLRAYNNGRINVPGLAEIGLIRVWTTINGTPTRVPYNGANITAVLENGECAERYVVNISRIWNDMDNFNFIDVNFNATWTVIYLSVTAYGQTVIQRLVNPNPIILPTFSWSIFNNGPGGTQYPRPNPGLAASGTIRMWAQLDGVNAPIYFDAADTIVALDQNEECAMQFVRLNRMWVAGTGWTDYFNMVDVNKNGDWEYINLYITVYGQTIHVLLVNALFEIPAEDITVTFVVEAGAVGVYAETTTTVEVPVGEAIPEHAIPDTAARTGFYFAGWYPSDPTEYGYVTEDVTFTAKFNLLWHYVTFEGSDGGELIPTDFGLVVRVRDGVSFWADRVPTPVANDGYEFAYWTPYNPAGFIVREDITFTAVFAPIEVVPVEPQIVSVTPVPVVIEQGSTVEITVTTQGMPDGAWLELNVAWRVGLSTIGGPRFYVVDNQATITLAADEDTGLGSDGFSVSARAAGDWGIPFIIDSYAFVIEVK